jgi:methylenetetrahydrofolate reductase (NADPH)
MRTSLEIVPRSGAELHATVELITTRYPRIDTVNIPDLANCELNSVDAVRRIGTAVAHRIPHLRSHDFDERSAERLAATLTASGIDEVVVVAGDRRSDPSPPDALAPCAMIRILGAHTPHLSIYAALDPHRYRDDAALASNVDQKLAAGAAGFFTQPLFDLRDVDRCARLLGGATTFWGLSPVVSDRSQRYWQRVNRVQFPTGFVPTLTWNHTFALRLLSEIAALGGNAYLMPIKVDIERYLAPLEARFAR